MAHCPRLSALRAGLQPRYLASGARRRVGYTAPLASSSASVSTIGFGDITAKTDAARLTVALQILLDLVIVGVILNVIVGAARTGLERQQGAQRDGELK
jgi:hypothetical protein